MVDFLKCRKVNVSVGRVVVKWDYVLLTWRICPRLTVIYTQRHFASRAYARRANTWTKTSTTLYHRITGALKLVHRRVVVLLTVKVPLSVVTECRRTTPKLRVVEGARILLPLVGGSCVALAWLSVWHCRPIQLWDKSSLRGRCATCLLHITSS
jgi:hypothetical protein